MKMFRSKTPITYSSEMRNDAINPPTTKLNINPLKLCLCTARADKIDYGLKTTVVALKGVRVTKHSLAHFVLKSIKIQRCQH